MFMCNQKSMRLSTETKKQCVVKDVPRVMCSSKIYIHFHGTASQRRKYQESGTLIGLLVAQNSAIPHENRICVILEFETF